MEKSSYSWLASSLNTIHRASWYRQVQTIEGRSQPVVSLDGQNLINFASNDYLGLAGDPRLMDAAIAAIKLYGTSSSGSRLLSGHRHVHRELEAAIANLKNTEDALVFSSGYLANLGAITAVVGSKDLLLGDEYNHSSLKNGAKLSGAKVVDYPHNNLTELAKILSASRHHYRRCLITTDSVFSMDGDLCCMVELIALAERFDCMLLVDEAHATGVLGATGAGCVEYFGCTGVELIQIGTLSKALGSQGGYVTGSAKLIDFLRNRAPTWIYTTGLSPADTAAALEAINIVKSEPLRRDNLWHNVDFLKQKLSHLNILPTQSPIICLGVESAETALNLAKSLKNKGIFAPAIRPPTVPTSRLRFSLMATHTKEHLEQLVLSLE